MTQDAAPLTAEERDNLIGALQQVAAGSPPLTQPMIATIVGEAIVVIERQATELAEAREIASRQAAIDSVLIASFDGNELADNWMGWRTNPDEQGRQFDIHVHLVGGVTVLDRYKQMETEIARLQGLAAFGSEVLRNILSDEFFFESEESERWCELLQRHGYVERGVWDSAKRGEHSVLEGGDEAWLFTDKMRTDAEAQQAAKDHCRSCCYLQSPCSEHDGHTERERFGKERG
jgi:hypothetical protein